MVEGACNIINILECAVVCGVPRKNFMRIFFQLLVPDNIGPNKVILLGAFKCGVIKILKFMGCELI